MSSLNKAAKSQKTHRERHQPSERSHLGLLEKKKDYRLRAKDYNEKKAVIKHLRKKALNKNPDEFYFHMINAKVVDGAHKDLVSKKVKRSQNQQQQIKLLQTQDYKYVSNKRMSEQRKIEKLRATLHLLDDIDKPKNTHTIFVDTDQEKRHLDLAKHFDTAPELLLRSSNRPRMDALNKETTNDPTSEHNVEKSQRKAYKQLSQRINRERQLQVIEEKMVAKKHLSDRKNAPSSIVKEETPETIIEEILDEVIDKVVKSKEKQVVTAKKRPRDQNAFSRSGYVKKRRKIRRKSTANATDSEVI